MTGWQVLDDVVKIGLGAALGLLGAWFADMRAWRKQRNARRIDTLESIAKDFEIAHQALIDLSVDVRARRVKLEALPSPKEAGIIFRGQINSVESRLQLLSYPQCVASLKKYSDASHDFMPAMIAEGSGAEESFRAAMGKLLTARAEFYCAMREQYAVSE